jgi:hypothetical protein
LASAPVAAWARASFPSVMECAAVLDARLWKEPFAAEEAHCDSALVDYLAVRLADDSVPADCSAVQT